MLKRLFFIFSLIFLLACDNQSDVKTLIIKGSETLTYFLSKEEVISLFAKKYPRYKLVLVGGGSKRGMASLLDDTADIAISSIPFSFEEKLQLKQMKLNPYSIPFTELEIRFIIHHKNDIVSIPLSRLQKIFSGQIETWTFEQKGQKKAETQSNVASSKKEMQQKNFFRDEKIILVGRRKSSGSYYWVDKIVLQNRGFPLDKTEFLDDFEEINFFKEQGTYAIGYISLPSNVLSNYDYVREVVITDDVNYTSTLNVNGVPTPFPEFHLTSPVSIVVRDMNDKVKPFVDFICSDEMKQFLKSHSLNPISCNKHSRVLSD